MKKALFSILALGAGLLGLNPALADNETYVYVDSTCTTSTYYYTQAFEGTLYDGWHGAGDFKLQAPSGAQDFAVGTLGLGSACLDVHPNDTVYESGGLICNCSKHKQKPNT